MGEAYSTGHRMKLTQKKLPRKKEEGDRKRCGK